MALKWLGARRLSVASDESTSFERQDEAIRECVAAIGGALLPEYADDYGVSASKIGPFEREGLGAWLRRPDAYDGIMFWRQDRAVRSMADMAELVKWARQFKKRLVFATGPGGRLELDLSSPISELIVLIFAFAAQMEAQAIKERVTGTRAYLPTVGRWPGGKIPYGYMPGPHPELPAGRWLVPEKVRADARRELIGRVIVGETYEGIADDFEARGIPAETVTVKDGKVVETPPEKRKRWTGRRVHALAALDTARGRAMKDGRTVRDASGAPILWGEALISDETQQFLTTAMEARSATASTTEAPTPRAGTHKLLGVAACGSCGYGMKSGWTNGGRAGVPRYQTLRCKAKAMGIKCPRPCSVVLERTWEYTEAQFLAVVGHLPIMAAVETPGIDHSAEITELTADIDELSAQLPGLRGAAAKAVVRQLNGRAERLEVLEAIPVVPARREWVPTGQTYGSRWATAPSDEMRRDMLRDAGAKVIVLPTSPGARDVTKRLRFEIRDQDAEYEAAMQDAAA